MSTPAPPDQNAIPILMELADTAPAGVRTLGREDQQPLFADLPPTAAPEKRVRPPAPSPAERLRVAKEMLRARAPAIVEEVAAAHQKQLAEVLRERLRRELSALLDDLAGPDDTPH